MYGCGLLSLFFMIGLILMQPGDQHKEVISRVLGFFSELTTMQDLSEAYVLDFYRNQRNGWVPEFNDQVFQEIQAYILDKIDSMQEIQRLLNDSSEDLLKEAVVEPFVPPLFEKHRSLTSNKHRTYSYSYPTSVNISQSCILYPPPTRWTGTSLHLDIMRSFKRLISNNVTSFLSVGEQAFLIGVEGDVRTYPCQAHVYKNDGRYTALFRSIYNLNSSRYLDVLIDSSVLAGRRRRLISRLIAATVINSFHEGTRVRIFTISDKLTKIYDGSNTLLNLSLLYDYDHVDGYYVKHSILLAYLSELTSQTQLVTVIISGAHSRSRRFLQFTAPPQLDICLIQTQSDLEIEWIYNAEVMQALSRYNFTISGYNAPANISQEVILTCKFLLHLSKGQGYTYSDRINEELKRISRQSTEWLRVFYDQDAFTVLNFTLLTHKCIASNECEYRTALEPVLARYRATRTVITPPTSISSAHNYQFMPFIVTPLIFDGEFIGVVACSLNMDALIALSELNTFYYLYGSINLIDFSSQSIVYTSDYGDWGMLRNYTDVYSTKTLINPRFTQLNQISQLFNVFLQAQQHTSIDLKLESAFISGISLYSFLSKPAENTTTSKCYSNILYDSDLYTDPKIIYDGSSKLILDVQETHESSEQKSSTNGYSYAYFVCTILSPLSHMVDSTISLFFITSTVNFLPNTLKKNVQIQSLDVTAIETLINDITLTAEQEKKFLDNLSFELSTDLIEIFINRTVFYAHNFLAIYRNTPEIVKALKTIILEPVNTIQDLTADIKISVKEYAHRYMRLALLYLKHVFFQYINSKAFQTTYTTVPERICSSYLWFGRLCISLVPDSNLFVRTPMLISKLRKASLTKGPINFYTGSPNLYSIETYFVTVYPDVSIERGITIGRGPYFDLGKIKYTPSLLFYLNKTIRDTIKANGGRSRCVFDCVAERELHTFNPADFNRVNMVLDACVGSDLISRLDKYGIIGVPGFIYETVYITNQNPAYKSFIIYMKHTHPFTGHLHMLTTLHINSFKFYNIMNKGLAAENQCNYPNCSIVLLNDNLYAVYNEEITNLPKTRLYNHTRDAEASNVFCGSGVYDLSFNGAAFNSGVGYITPLLCSGNVCVQYAMTPDILTYAVNLSVLGLNQVDRVWGISKSGLYLYYSSNEKTSLIKNYGQTLCLKSYTVLEETLASLLSSAHEFKYSNKNITITGYRISDTILETMESSPYSLYMSYLSIRNAAFTATAVLIGLILVLICTQTMMRTSIEGIRLHMYLNTLLEQ